VCRAIEEKRAKWGSADAAKDPYVLVSRELKGTIFAAKPSMIKKSYSVVIKACKANQHHRFWLSGNRDLMLYSNMCHQGR